MKQRDILFLLISTFIIIIAWIIFSIYDNLVVSTISTPLSIQISPINPDFDAKTIENLKNREVIYPIYEMGNVIPTPEETATTPAQQQLQGGTAP